MSDQPMQINPQDIRHLSNSGGVIGRMKLPEEIELSARYNLGVLDDLLDAWGGSNSPKPWLGIVEYQVETEKVVALCLAEERETDSIMAAAPLYETYEDEEGPQE